MDGSEMHIYELRRHVLRFIDFYSSKIMIIVDNVLILIKPQAQLNFDTLNVIFGIDVNDVKCFKS